MSLNSLALRRPRATSLLPRGQSRLERLRVTLGDGARTTLHVASYDMRAHRGRVVAFERPTRLVQWCADHGVSHAVVGGFFLRPTYAPLGHLWIDGEVIPSVAFDPPWGESRASVQIDASTVRVARRDRLGPDPDGDLLQAGPLLVQRGERAVADDEDSEGFSAGSHQFDSDITLGRYPRAALAIAGDWVLAVACDGRAPSDAGMTLAELADALLALGATDALNLDGGGSASLVHDGRLRNRPREQNGADLLEGREVVTAIAFEAL
jgi:Phosphodiester glycosidase